MKPLGPNNELHLPQIEAAKYPLQLTKADQLRINAQKNARALITRAMGQGQQVQSKNVQAWISNPQLIALPKIDKPFAD